MRTRCAPDRKAEGPSRVLPRRRLHRRNEMLDHARVYAGEVTERLPRGLGVHDDIVDESVDAARKAPFVAWCASNGRTSCAVQTSRAVPASRRRRMGSNRRLIGAWKWTTSGCETLDVAGDLARREEPEPRAVRVEAEGGRLRASPRAGGESSQSGRRPGEVGPSSREPRTRRRLLPPLVTRARATECRSLCRHGGTGPRAAHASSVLHVALARTQVARATRSIATDRPLSGRSRTSGSYRRRRSALR